MNDGIPAFMLSKAGGSELVAPPPPLPEKPVEAPFVRTALARELVDVGELDRGTYIGGGDVAAIMGVNPWRTPLDVYLSKTGQARPAAPDPAREKRFKRGKRLEPYIIDMLAEDHGITITARNARYRDPEFPWMAAEIDFEWHDALDPRIRNGEVKTVQLFPGAHNPWGEEGTDEIPVYYGAQSMYGLMITGREVCQYGTLFGMDNMVLYQLERDEETIVGMREAVKEFWFTYVVPRVPPPPQTMADLAKLWPRETRETIVATPAIVEIIEEHKALSEKLKLMTERKDEISFLIGEFVKDFATVITMPDGKKLATYKAQTRESIDGKGLKATLPAIYAQYARSTEFRVLRHSTSKKG